jgi:hypothetical protein
VGAAGGRSSGGAVVERERRKRRGVGVGTVAAIGAAALAVAVLGFVIGSSGGGEDEEPAGSRTVSAGALDLNVPDDWRPASGATAIPGLEYTESVSLTPPGGTNEGTVTAGFTNARGRSLLPTSFVRQLGEPPPMTDGVRLGELEAYRYSDLKPSGFNGRLTVYVAPTSEGVATVACSAPGSSASSFMPACEGVATSLDLTSGTATRTRPSRTTSTRSTRPSGASTGSAAAAGASCARRGTRAVSRLRHRIWCRPTHERASRSRRPR